MQILAVSEDLLYEFSKTLYNNIVILMFPGFPGGDPNINTIQKFRFHEQ